MGGIIKELIKEKEYRIKEIRLLKEMKEYDNDYVVFDMDYLVIVEVVNKIYELSLKLHIRSWKENDKIVMKKFAELFCGSELIDRFPIGKKEPKTELLKNLVELLC